MPAAADRRIPADKATTAAGPDVQIDTEIVAWRRVLLFGDRDERTGRHMVQVDVLVSIQSLVLRSTNKGVPIILGLTGVTQW